MTRRAFTLIECLVALVVLAMMAAAVMPFFTRLARGRLHAERDLLAIDLLGSVRPGELRSALKPEGYHLSGDPDLYLRAVELTRTAPDPHAIASDPKAFTWTMPPRRWLLVTVTADANPEATPLASAVLLMGEERVAAP